MRACSSGCSCCRPERLARSESASDGLEPSRRVVRVAFEELHDPTLGVAPLAADPYGSESPALGESEHGLLVNAQQLSHVSGLVVLLEHFAVPVGLVRRG